MRPVLCLTDINDQTDGLACPDSLVASGAKINSIVSFNGDTEALRGDEASAQSHREPRPLPGMDVPKS